jgi:hypothetical protein
MRVLQDLLTRLTPTEPSLSNEQGLCQPTAMGNGHQTTKKRY